MQLLVVCIIVFTVLVIFSCVTVLLLCPVGPFRVSLRLVFPILFFNGLAFVFSAVAQDKGKATMLVVVVNVMLVFFDGVGDVRHSF